MKKIIFIFSLFLLFSCSSYNKILKSNDVDEKYSYAVGLFENKDYFKSLQLLCK